LLAHPGIAREDPSPEPDVASLQILDGERDATPEAAADRAVVAAPRQRGLGETLQVPHGERDAPPDAVADGAVPAARRQAGLEEHLRREPALTDESPQEEVG